MTDPDNHLDFVARPRFLLTAAVTGLVIVGVLVVAPWSKPGPTSEIRVRNATSTMLHSVIVGGTSYGDIGIGETTGYKSWGPAFSTSRVQFELDKRLMRRIPDDHVGDSPLGSGTFTFVLSANNPTSDADFSVDVVRE